MNVMLKNFQAKPPRPAGDDATHRAARAALRQIILDELPDGGNAHAIVEEAIRLAVEAGAVRLDQQETLLSILADDPTRAAAFILQMLAEEIGAAGDENL